jgi:hypothetical protein
MQEAASPVHDQAFFLALAREGRDAWNKWRHANANVAITFEGVDFEAAGTGVNFRRFEFGDHANFSGATFGHRARFAGARFGEEASFRCATFGDAADFEGVTFGDRADLSNAAFGDTADFRRASFGNSAGLRGTTFGYWTKLSRVKFEGRAFLSGVILGDRTTLSEAIFKSDVDLRAMSNEEWQREISQVLSRSSLTQSWPDERKRKFLADREILHRSQDQTRSAESALRAQSSRAPRTFPAAAFRTDATSGPCASSSRRYSMSARACLGLTSTAHG